jgi:hypothetical protein
MPGSLPPMLRALLTVLLAISGTLFVPAVASAYSLNAVSINTADPTESVTVAVSVSGSSTDYKSLWLYVRSGTSSCASTAATEQSVAVRSLITGRSVTGAITEAASFSLSEPGTYRLCAYIAATSGAAPLATSTGTVTIRPATASLSSLGATTADPSESLQVAVSVSGTSEIYKSLWVYLHPGTGSCASTTVTESAVAVRSLITGRSVSGAFTEAATFAINTPGTYRLCAYVAASNGVTPLATRTATVTIRPARASLTAATVTSADPTEGRAVAISLSGTSEIYKSLTVFLHAGAGPCPGTVSGAAATAAATLLSGRSVIGSFTETASFTPSAPGAYRVCSYVGDDDAPIAASTGAVQVRAATASISSITVTTPSPTAGSYVYVQVAGSTETPGSLYAFAREGAAPCAGTARDEEAAGSSEVFSSYGSSLSAGSFTKTDYFYVTYGGEYRICAYVAGELAATPRASGNAVVTLAGNRRPVTTGCAAFGAKPAVKINDGAAYTRSPDVYLTLSAASSCSGTLLLANNGGFTGARSTPFTKEISWMLDVSGPESQPKTVHAQFPGIAGSVADEIVLDTGAPRLASVRARSIPGTRLGNGSRIVSLSLRASDSGSGVAQVQVNHKARRSTVIRRFASAVRVRVWGNPLRVRVTDRAGNVSGWRTVRG